jgi:MFS transporter, DHA2 family, multidrug resistance protein
VLTRELGASDSARLWIINAYPLVVAGLLPGLGTLGDRFGHRRLFVAGLVIFGVASLAAAYAPTTGLLIAARALQGVGGATMMPATLAIIRSTFSDKRERAWALGIWSGVASGGMALGPIIAGALLEHFWWGSVFLINVPVIAIALVATLWVIPRTPPPGGAPWDLTGSLQLLVGLTALVFAIKEVAHQPFSLMRVAVALATGIAFIAVYLRGQRTRAQPLIDLTLFRRHEFAAGFAAASCSTAGAVGVELALGQHLQLVLHRSPLEAAMILVPMPLGAFIAGPLAGWLLHRVQATLLMVGGLGMAAICALLLPVFPLSIWLLTGIGGGIGATVTCASTTVMNAAPPERAGMAASIEEVGFEMGGAVGIAVFGTLLTLVYRRAPAEALDAVLVGAALLWCATGLIIKLTAVGSRSQPP